VVNMCASKCSFAVSAYHGAWRDTDHRSASRCPACRVKLRHSERMRGVIGQVKLIQGPNMNGLDSAPH
jgi:hypothetical protein